MLSTFCLAQDDSTKQINTLLTWDVLQKAISDVNQIKVFFCNWDSISDSLFLNVTPGIEKDVCLRFENANDNKVSFASDFFETSITAWWSPVCNSKDSVNLFTKSIINKWNKITRVPGKSYIEKNFKLKFPVWYSGLYHFCHYYKIDWWGSSIPMFNIVVHKQNFMDIFVNSEGITLTWVVEVLNFVKNKDNVYFSVKNTFPFDQELNFSVVVSNIFWFKRTLWLSWGLIWYNASKDFALKVSDLPYYKGPFSLNVKIDYRPHFDFDIKNSDINQGILDGWTMEQSINFFVFDKIQLIILIVLALIIFLVKMAFFTKPKVIYE